VIFYSIRQTEKTPRSRFEDRAAFSFLEGKPVD